MDYKDYGREHPISKDFRRDALEHLNIKKKDIELFLYLFLLTIFINIKVR